MTATAIQDGRIPKRVAIAAWLAVLVSFQTGCTGESDSYPTAIQAPGEWKVPKASDWADRGRILEAGDESEWDRILWGGFTNSAILKDGILHLYYQGSSSVRTEYDETVCSRSIGLALGFESFDFQKHRNNPVVAWSPTDECEEGAAAGAVTLAEDGEVLLYYGANTSTGRTTVSADVRLARSADGIEFEDRGIVLDHFDRNVWGHGDELFPLAALRDENRYIVYYVPNGGFSRRQLGVAWGSSPHELGMSSAVRASDRRRIPVWGAMGACRVGPNRYALFIRKNLRSAVEVRMVSTLDPANLSEPVEIYPTGGELSVTVLLDAKTPRWLMIYRGSDHYGLKTAPAVRMAQPAE